MNILWISPTPSHPQNAGNRAHIRALGSRILSAGHSVTFLLYDQEGRGSSPDAIDAMRSFWSEIFVVPHKQHNRKKTDGDTWGIDDWYNQDIDLAVRILSSRKIYDVVICEYVFLSKALTHFDERVLKILNCHDRMSGRADLLRRIGLSPDFFYTTPEQEKIALDRADLILAIQNDEKSFFQSITSKCVMELGHPVEVNLLTHGRRKAGMLRVGYLGSINSLNKKSLEVFLAEFRKHPALAEKVKLVMAGNICNIIEDPDIECLGFVENEGDFFNEIDLFVNPMIDGTGLKIKTLSAVRHGVPFLATVPASVGLPTRTPAHNCESIESLINHLEEVASDPQKYLPDLRQATLDCLNAYQQRIGQQFADLLRALSSRSIAHLRRKRVLLVTDIPFWEPGVGSHSRIMSLCRALRAEFDFQVFFYGSIWPARKKAIAAAGLDDVVISYKDYEAAAEDVPFKTSIPAHAGLKRARHDIFGKSLALFLRKQPRYDAVIFEYLWLAYLRDALPYPSICILDTHDLMAPREYRFVKEGLTTNVSITLKDEVAIFERFDALIAIQNEEASWMARLVPNKIVLCCPHGVETVREALTERLEAGRGRNLRVGFVGGDSNVNAEAMRWFLHEVWPVVNQLAIELHVYGNVCEKLRDQPLDVGVTLHGLVSSLDVAYAHCDVMINPIIHGGGLKIKSVEALAHGKPLIASPEGAVGIDDPQNSGVIVARSRSEFIDAVLRLVKNPEERESLARQALAASQEQFSPAASFATLIEFVRSL